jgi:SOS-response transcriptional repressor LexA
MDEGVPVGALAPSSFCGECGHIRRYISDISFYVKINLRFFLVFRKKFVDWIRVIDIAEKTLIANGKNKADLAKVLGVRSQYLSDIRSGKSKNPGPDFILALINQLGFNPKWLELGTGDMFLSQEPEKPTKEEKHPLVSDIEAIIKDNLKEPLTKVESIVSRLSALENKYAKLAYLPENKPAPEAEYPAETGDDGGYAGEPEPEYGEMPYYEDVAAGPPIWQSDDYSLVVKVPLRLIKTELSDYYALRVKGNSMIDAFIPDGSLALIRKSDAPQHGKIQVVRIDGRSTLKRVREGEDHSWTLCYEDGIGRAIPLGRKI